MGNKQKPDKPQELQKRNIFNTIEWPENLTFLDLSNREIINFENNIKFPPNLMVLNLSKNKFTEVPNAVLKLNTLKRLDLSYNQIQWFDDPPNFCHTVENLNLNNNELERPPFWVWTESPKHLVQLNLSHNINICHSLCYYIEEICQYTTLVKQIDMYNCSLGKHMKLMRTFKHAKILNLGSEELSYHSVNHIEDVPCIGLEDCCTTEILNLCNTHVYTILPTIDIYQNLIELNLSQNNINSLPNEFCNLKNLEKCMLSFNKILYLPDDMCKLIKLSHLYLDNNELCMIPDSLEELKCLKSLDLYNNHLYDGLNDISCLEQYDFAQNYYDEPIDNEYLMKKAKLRGNCCSRLDGRAPEVFHEEKESQDNSEVDYGDDEDVNDNQDVQEAYNSRASSPEDWDSDDHWIPSHVDFCNPILKTNRQPSPTSPTARWLDFVKRKMNEGNFCPMDMHLSISITEKVKYEKLAYPQPEYESDGQFDDYSEDDS